MTRSQPLQGIKIIDLTRALSGPFCTTLLSDMGADVIKVEGIAGDMIRGWGPFVDEISVYHLAVNRNKRSVALDLRSDSGKELLRRLVDQSDVLVENFRPGVLKKLGLDPDVLEVQNPKLIIARVTGFGPGEMVNDAGFDQIAQGMGGLMAVTGTVGSGPMRVGVPIADILAGMFTAFGVASSLAGRGATGLANRVETSLLESVIGVLTFQAQRYLSLQETPEPMGNDHPILSPYGVYQAKDKSFNLAVGTESQWRKLCEVLDASELTDSTEFASNDARRENRELLRQQLNRHFSRRSADELVHEFKRIGVPAGIINDIPSVFADSHVKGLDLVTYHEREDLGRIPVLRGPIRLGGDVTPVRRPAPTLGQHTFEVLSTELGISQGELEDLQSMGAVSCAQAPERTEDHT